MINDWIISKGMALAHQKTEAVVLTRKWAYARPTFFVGSHQVAIKKAIKYLGVTLDSKLTFTTHVKAVSASATTSAKAIGRLLPNVGGPSMAKRLLLATVVQAKLLYAAPVWTERAANFKTNVVGLNRSLRLAAIRVARCYRTVFTSTALVLAGLPPTGLLAMERLSLRRIKTADTTTHPPTTNREIRAQMLQEWQPRWAIETQVRGGSYPPSSAGLTDPLER